MMRADFITLTCTQQPVSCASILQFDVLIIYFCSGMMMINCAAAGASRTALRSIRTSSSTSKTNARLLSGGSAGGDPISPPHLKSSNDSSPDRARPLLSGGSAGGDPISPPHLKSSNDSSPDRARPNDNSDFISEHQVDPIRALFPWRHSPSPLPRLCPGTLEYISQGGYVGPGMPPLNRWVRGALYWNAASMLNIPSYKVLLFRGWEEEMASQFAWAFQIAVAGLLSRTYHVPMESIVSRPGSSLDVGDEETAEGGDFEDGNDSLPIELEPSSFVVNFDQTVAPPPHPTDITEPKPKDDFDDENAPELEYMLQKQLRCLYETAHEHTRHNLQIRLQTEPYDAEIMSMFLIPFITRERVEATPALRHALRNVWVHLEEKEEKLGRRLGMGEAISEIAGELESLAKKQADSQGVVESTIICQALIKCREIFAVKDVELDQVVQGDPEGKVNDVTHLVRFEMKISASINGGPSTLGSWQITDIDDLLEGNVWYT